MNLDLPGYDVAKQLQADLDEMGIKYIHLTHPENAVAIKAEGLKSESGMIFFTDTALTVAHIALNQVFAKEFHLFGVRHGKAWKFHRDDVAEFMAGHQWIHRAKAIGPSKLVDLGRWRAIPPYDQFMPCDAESIGFPSEWSEEEKEARRGELREEYKRGIWPPFTLAYLEPHGDEDDQKGGAK
ncbi:MAG: hypothetical protein P4L85_19625 [Paludisphaera borealis]|uniref:hypothetical protein n=1 Tax=Paludisphaera borealis TaxID=1387353 RepID=UPI00284A91DE|nr:hypothetical protein [Paludisphaera borealis]MDR3621571.1 hypothetical protein [Paludisphaera borealis]